MRYLIAILFLVFFASQAFATTFYVSTSGSDNSECSEGNPCRWLNNLNDGTPAVSPGDTIIIKNGTYYAGESGLTIKSAMNGTSGSHVTIQAETYGSVIFDGQDLYETAFDIYGNTRYIDFIGLIIQKYGNGRAGSNYGNTGDADGCCHHITFTYCRWEDNWDGGMFTIPLTRHFTWDKCIFANNGDEDLCGQCGGEAEHQHVCHSHDLYLGGGGHVVKNCLFWNHNTGWCIRINGFTYGDDSGYTGIATEAAWSPDSDNPTILIVNNTFAYAGNDFVGHLGTSYYQGLHFHAGHINFWTNPGGYGCSLCNRAPDYVTIENNLFLNPSVSYHTWEPGNNGAIQMLNWFYPDIAANSDTSMVTTMRINNNVTNGDHLVHYYDRDGTPKNICYAESGVLATDGMGTSDFDQYNNNKDGTNTPAIHDHATMGMNNPTLGNDDFSLDGGSFATTYLINQGLSTRSPSDDFEGNSRSGNPDIGAYEYQGESGTPDPLKTMRVGSGVIFRFNEKGTKINVQ